MPNYKGHVFGGLALYCIIILIMGICSIPHIKYAQWLCATVLGSLFPDIDTKSKGQEILYKSLFIILLFCLVYKAYFQASLLGFCSMIPLVTRHRGLFHEFWFLVMLTISCTLVFLWFLPNFSFTIISNAFFFMVGFGSHLCLDRGFKRMLNIK